MERTFDDSQAATAAIAGVRELSADPLLGLGAVDNLAPDVTSEAIGEFCAFLRALALSAGGFDEPVAGETLIAIGGVGVEWRRQSFRLFPVYVERLRIVPAESFSDAGLGVPMRVAQPGVWEVSADVLLPGERNFRAQTQAWESLICAESAHRPNSSGGLSFNLLRIESQSLSTGSVDLRPLVLHALRPDGGACDRGRPKAQAAVANSFWQTYWATGALRSQRGVVFPVAFLPIDRACPIEFAPPFRQRWVSLRRCLHGRTAILAHANEILTARRALLFDLSTSRFVIAADFQPEAAGLTRADAALAIFELNRTGFVDSHTGDNREIFAEWRRREDSATARGAAWSAESWEAEGVYHECVAGPDADRDSMVRIRRVVPFAGAAYLSQIVHETRSLVEDGKIQELDGEIVAATNSVFFLNFPEEYAVLHSAMNDPVALLVESGWTHSVATLRRAAFFLDNRGRAAIATGGENSALAGPPLDSEGAQAENPFPRACLSFRENLSNPAPFGMVLVGAGIVETFEESQTAIPLNGLVTSYPEIPDAEVVPGFAATAGAPPGTFAGGGVAPLRHAFAVGPLLVSGGRIVKLGASGEEFQPIVLRGQPDAAVTAELARTELPGFLLDCERRGVPPTRFPYDWDKTRAPRTALGIASDGAVLLVVVDGRADLSHSIGLTLAELARLMANLGCRDALNLDGGGSSVMFVNDPAANRLKIRPELRDGIVNLPSDAGGVERMLPVPLLVVRKPLP